MSIALECEFSGTYHVYFLDVLFSADQPRSAVQNFLKTNGHILRAALSAISARPGLVGRELAQTLAHGQCGIAHAPEGSAELFNSQYPVRYPATRAATMRRVSR